MDPFPAPERRELAIGIMAERRIPCNFGTKGIQCGLVLSLLLDRGLVITEQRSHSLEIASEHPEVSPSFSPQFSEVIAFHYLQPARPCHNARLSESSL